MGWKGKAAGSVLGFIAGDLPGAVAGYKLGNYMDVDLPQKNSMVNTRKRKYGSPSKSAQAKRAKLGYVTSGGKAIGRATYDEYRARVAANNSRHSRVIAGKRVAVKKKSKIGHKHSSGSTYAGKFKKPRKHKKSMEQRFLSQGFLSTTEQYGTVADPDCVYLIHSTGYLLELANVMNVALLRKVMNKAGFKITNVNNEIAASAPISAGVDPAENSSGLRFVFTCKQMTTMNTRNYVYDTLDNQSFMDVTRLWTDMRDRIVDFFRGQGEILEPYRIAVYQRDSTIASNNWNLGAEIFLEDCHMEIAMASNLVVQNRTLASLDTIGVAADQVSTDRVDAQPVKGWLYEFKHADPRTRHSAAGATATISSNEFWTNMRDMGIRLIRGEQFTGNVSTVGGATTVITGATEPFVPKYFANCVKSSRILLQPGEVKKTGFTWKLSGKVINIFKKLKVVLWQGTDSSFAGMVGKCQMIALEEVMRTPSTNKVTIAYERELKIGVIVKPHFKQAPVETSVISEMINNP